MLLTCGKMVRQYPHIIKLTTSTDAAQDNSGNWSPGVEGTIEKQCRAEINDGGYITATDGRRIDFSWVVYLPLPMDKVKEGSRIELFEGSEKIATDTVKRFYRGQLNARIWL